MFLTVKVEYAGTKSYNKSFKDDGFKDEVKSTTYPVENLVPGSQYDFEVYATSVCGKSLSTYVKVETGVEGEHFLETDINFVNFFCSINNLKIYNFNSPIELLFCFVAWYRKRE